jgi:effector-binding domain-containing protein
MFTEPKIEACPPIAYAGIRGLVSMGELGTAIPKRLDESLQWLSEKGATPNGAPLIRFHTCPEAHTQDALMDICIGWPIPAALPPEGNFICDSLPEGKYASLIYTGVENGIPGNRALIDWARKNQVRWESWEVKGGEGFAGRVEHLLDGPEDDPNPSNWRTQVAIKVVQG